MPDEEEKCLPEGEPPGKPRERSLNLNNIIFAVPAPSYAYMQNLSQIRDVACSTYCMDLHGFFVDSLLGQPKNNLARSELVQTIINER